MLIPTDASACTCSGDSKPPTAAALIRQVRGQLNDALAVFIGEPIAMNTLTVRFRVQSFWKGELGNEVVMASGPEPTSDGLVSKSTCIASFEFGQTYLVFANGTTHETMKARVCGFTSRLQYTEIPKTLDQIVSRRPPTAAVTPRKLIAVVGLVRRPGVIEWREGMTVADAVRLAGGTIPPRPIYAHALATSRISRKRPGADDERLPALPTALLLPDDTLSVGTDLDGKRF